MTDEVSIVIVETPIEVAITVEEDVTAEIDVTESAVTVDITVSESAEEVAVDITETPVQVDITVNEAIQDHDELGNLAFDDSGHTGFQEEGDYITTETDPVFLASQAFNIDAGDIVNLGNLSGVNTGDQDLSSFLTDAPSDGSTYGRKDGAWAVVTGIVDHSLLSNLDYASAGHTGFLSAADAETTYLKLVPQAPLIGPLIHRNASNSTTAFQIQQADGTVVGNWDTMNKRLGINITPLDSLHISRAKNSKTNVNFTGLLVSDSSPFAEGVGGGIVFKGFYRDSFETTAAAIHAYKTNATSSNFSFDLAFNTRIHGGGNTEKLRITDVGNIRVNIGDIFVTKTNDQTTSGSIYGMRFVVTANPTGNSSATYQGITGQLQFVSANNFIVPSFGFRGTGLHSGTGTINEFNSFSSGISVDAAGIIVDAAGLRIDTPSISGGGAITNLYGIYLENQNVGTTLNYAIFTNAGINRLGDQLHVVGSQDIVQGIYQANATQTAALVQHRTSNADVHNEFFVPHASNLYETVFNKQSSPLLDFLVKSDTYDAFFIDASENSIDIMHHASGRIGFYAQIPTTQQVLATGAGATVDNVITALQTLGLVKQA